MIGFNHAMAGVIVAAVTPAPFVPVVALCSHFVMDAFPHFGNSATCKPYTTSFKWLLVIDALLCTLVLGSSFFLFPDKWWLMIVGTFFATLPDFLWLIEKKVSWMKPYFTFAKRIQWSETPDGWTYEIGYFTLQFLIIVLLV